MRYTSGHFCNKLIFKMEDEILWFFLLLACSAYLFAKKRVRRFAVRPVNRLRDEKGLYANLLTQLIVKNDEELFFKYTRMTVKMFFHLLCLVEQELQKDDTKNPIPPAHRLILTLHYLSSGCSMQEIAFGHYLGLSTVSAIIKETVVIIWHTLQPLVLKPPSDEEWKNIEFNFYKRWNFPNCVGAVDGKHISIQAPYNAGSEFFNYKKQHSLVLMAACDSGYKFTLVDIGAAGGCHDSVVFSESTFGNQLLNTGLNLPQPKNLPGSNIELPHFFVADAAFPLHKHIMRPYPGKNLSQAKKIFNYRLSRARRTIESTFGILAQRWRILRSTIIADFDMCEKITMACVALHNFIQSGEESLPVNERRYCPSDIVGNELLGGRENNLRSVKRLGANNAPRNIITNRERLLEYLNSPEGSVSWQLDHILAGSVPNEFSRNYSF